jgi:hypothetical protein
MSAKIMNQDTINAGLEVEQRLAQELPSVMPNAAFVVGSATMTSAQVVTQVEQHIANERALIALRAQLAAAEANIKVERAAVKATVKAVKAGATAALGVTSAQFQALGFETPKPRKPSVKVKAEGVDKNLATRVARGTKGSRQKEAIHGTVPATPPLASAPTPATPAVVK